MTEEQLDELIREARKELRELNIIAEIELNKNKK